MNEQWELGSGTTNERMEWMEERWNGTEERGKYMKPGGHWTMHSFQ